MKAYVEFFEVYFGDSLESETREMCQIKLCRNLVKRGGLFTLDFSFFSYLNCMMIYTKRKLEFPTYLSYFYMFNNFSNFGAFHQDPFLPLTVASYLLSCCREAVETLFGNCEKGLCEVSSSLHLKAASQSQPW